MLTSVLKKPAFFNQDLHNYSLKSTNDSIKRMVEKYDEERKNNLFHFNIITKDNFSPEPNKNPVIPIIFFLSVSSFLYYFYKSKR